MYRINPYLDKNIRIVMDLQLIFDDNDKPNNALEVFGALLSMVFKKTIILKLSFQYEKKSIMK